MQYNPGNLFLGSTPAHERSYLCEVLRHARKHYKRLLIPCCGKFAAAETAVAAGWKPAQICGSDVSLFSSVLGYHLSGRPLAELGVRLAGDLACLDPTDPATVLYCLKLATLRQWAQSAGQYHKRLLVRDVERRIAHHIQTLQKHLDALAANLAGLEYRARDLFDHLPEAMDDPEAVVYCAPPAYLRGYEKMFDTGGAIEWNAPAYQLFDPAAGYPAVRRMMAGKPALGVRFVYAELEPDEGAEVLCVEATGGATGRSGAEYILSNRPDEVGGWIPRMAFVPWAEIQPIAAPILDDSHKLTPNSRIEFRRVGVPQAMYYRDLFAHRLGTTSASEHFLLVLDGRVAGVVGFGSAFSRTFQQRQDGRAYMTEMYDFTAPSDRYPRLNRLLMMLICSEQMHALWKPRETPVQRYAGISTTCLCEHPELKINRGILKLVSRERQKNALWKLSYTAEWRKETFAEALQRWLKTQGSEKHSRLK